MPLLKGETWDDYNGKQVYVTMNEGETGFLAHFVSYNNEDGRLLIQDDETQEYQIIEEEYVYGTWILEDW